MSDDLVTRARQYEGQSFETTACYNGLRDELAARIEQDAATIARLTGEVRFTATDGQRLLRRSDVEGVCDDIDACFERPDSVVRCGPCAVKLATKSGIDLNKYTPGNPQAMKLRRELTAAEATAARLRAELDEARGALLPVLAIAERNERGVETDRARAILAKIDGGQ